MSHSMLEAATGPCSGSGMVLVWQFSHRCSFLTPSLVCLLEYNFSTAVSLPAFWSNRHKAVFVRLHLTSQLVQTPRVLLGSGFRVHSSYYVTVKTNHQQKITQNLTKKTPQLFPQDFHSHLSKVESNYWESNYFMACWVEGAKLSKTIEA